MSAPSVLILGSRGRLGAAAATAFQEAGWRVLAHSRKGTLCVPLDNTRALATAAAGAQVVVYAINPPYTRWSRALLPMARQGMDVAQQLDATFMLPGNIYAYGEGMPPLLSEDTPEQPSTDKGRLRQTLENEMAARAATGLKSVVLRAGDFFGAGRGVWFDTVISKDLHKGHVVYPGPLHVQHAWAYLPDLARTLVAVADLAVQGRLAPHERLHFAGHTLTGQQLVRALSDAAQGLGLPAVNKVKDMPWAVLRLCSPVVPLWREVLRMSYLWRVPHALDGSRLQTLLGGHLGHTPYTPLAQALTAALQDLGLGAAQGAVSWRGAASR
jgi:nucleoside-diphosphate-sugar epimerase